jgi:hypothetical protein
MATRERRDERRSGGTVDAELVGEVDDPLGRGAVVEVLEILADGFQGQPTSSAALVALSSSRMPPRHAGWSAQSTSVFSRSLTWTVVPSTDVGVVTNNFRSVTVVTRYGTP